MGSARGIIEDRARQMGAARLVDPGAAWRWKPASEKQRAVLYRRGIRAAHDITAGEASDMIAAGRRGA